MTDTNIAAPVSTAERPRGCWLVLIYRLPAQPSSARTAVSGAAVLGADGGLA